MAMAVSCPLSSPLDDERWRFGEELTNRVLWWTLMTGERSTLTPELDRREDADAAELRGVDIARSLVSRSSGVAEAMDTLIATLAALIVTVTCEVLQSASSAMISVILATRSLYSSTVPAA